MIHSFQVYQDLINKSMFEQKAITINTKIKPLKNSNNKSLKISILFSLRANKELIAVIIWTSLFYLIIFFSKIFINQQNNKQNKTKKKKEKFV